MTEALSLYHRLKGTNKTKLFFESSDRSVRYFADCLGHEKLDKITSKDKGLFRDYLFDRGVPYSSIKRVFSTVRAIINLAIKENGLGWSNVFSGTYIPEDFRTTKRVPIPPDRISKIQKDCFDCDHEARWLIATVQPPNYVLFFNRVSGTGGLMSRA